MEIFNNPKFQAFDSNGDPYTGAQLFTYVVGTTTKKATYSDYDLSTANTNPIVLDSRGEAVVYGEGAYKFVLATPTASDPPAGGDVIWTMDNIYLDSYKSKTIGNGAAEDTKLVFDGNAQDYYIGLDDGTDDLMIGLGSAVGTTPAISIDENLDVNMYGNVTVTDATNPTITVTDSTGPTTTVLQSNNADGIVGTTTTHPFKIYSDNTLSATVDVSQNWTFAGTTVTLSNATNPTFYATDTTNSISCALQANNVSGTVGTSTDHPLALITDGATRITIDNSASGDGCVKIETALKLAERAAAIADTAGYGQFWVLTNTPNLPKFTDDIGADYHIALSDGDTGGTGSAGAGNQYVELYVAGTTYKVLHDGTV